MSAPTPPTTDVPEVCHSLMERSPVPMAELEGVGHIVRYVNPAFCRLVGKSREALTGNPVAEAVQQGDGCLATLDRVFSTGEAETHTEPEHPEPHPAYWSYAIWPVLGAAQHPIGVVMQVTETTRFHQQVGAMNEALLISSVRQHELTEAAEKLNVQLQAEIAGRERHQERLKMLLHELNHRVKNTLAIVQSIATQTLRNTSDTEQARRQFEGRLIALSKAHDTLTQESWEGAPLERVVADAVAPYRAQKGDRFEIDGPNVWIPPNYALALALALHELSTNAVKYGALSNESGRVGIEWTVAGTDAARELRMRWSETGGPPVAAPERRGFGSRLLERGLKQDLGGEVDLDFAATGVVCTIEAPLRGGGGTLTHRIGAKAERGSGDGEERQRVARARRRG